MRICSESSKLPTNHQRDVRLTDKHISVGNESQRSSSGQETPKLAIKPSQPCLALSQIDLQGRCTSPAIQGGANTEHTKKRMSTEHTVCTMELKNDILAIASL